MQTKCLKECQEVRGRFAVYRHVVASAWMKELKVRGVESDARDAPFQFFLWIVLSVRDDGVADGGELDADLIL